MKLDIQNCEEIISFGAGGLFRAEVARGSYLVNGGGLGFCKWWDLFCLRR